MNKSLRDKVAIITGASKGIGKGIAKLFADGGAKLVLTGRDEKSLENVARSLGDNVIPV